jgi:propanol-preferring alcohol dehydrogenase
MTMAAMVLERIARGAAEPLAWREVSTPEPGPGEVRLRVRCCGVCRTDLHVIDGDLPPQKLPLVPGHQVVGIVDALGPGCTRLRLGQRIGVAWLRHTCGRCDSCRTGRENLCAAPRFTGYHADGGYAEFALVPEDYAYELPAGLADTAAAPLLCAGIIGYRALQRAQVPARGRLALYGFGSSAHIVLQLARHRGHEVFVVTRGAAHRELARQMGAAWVGESASELPALVDSAILFAPAGELIPAALERLAPGGTLACAGIYVSPIPTLDYERHLFYERDVRTVTANTRADGRTLLAEAVAAGVQPHVVEFGLRDANRALAELRADRIRGTAVLLVGG